MTKPMTSDSEECKCEFAKFGLHLPSCPVETKERKVESERFRGEVRAKIESERKLAKEAQSEAPSVDVLTDKLRELLNKDDVWSSEYNSVLLEIEESATPEPPQDTSLDEWFEDGFCGLCGSTTKDATQCYNCGHEIPSVVLSKVELLDWHKAEIAKLFEQIRSEVDDLLSEIEGDNNPSERTLGHFKDAQDGKRSMSALLQVLLANEYYRLGEFYVIKEVREALSRLEDNVINGGSL